MIQHIIYEERKTYVCHEGFAFPTGIRFYFRLNCNQCTFRSGILSQTCNPLGKKTSVLPSNNSNFIIDVTVLLIMNLNINVR